MRCRPILVDKKRLICVRVLLVVCMQGLDCLSECGVRGEYDKLGDHLPACFVLRITWRKDTGPDAQYQRPASVYGKERRYQAEQEVLSRLSPNVPPVDPTDVV
ncbi:hypothetical protein BD626DRAFT_33111 [Schizophyllum amplum]|uniref:Uncharacterized protein n=1 Tax=Schizophyllum amplum TaxID=97359 RepID=A0A550CE84_9AGAR|nr:hypothetical protein BD626DRAFT_33111 [Auriculariopsis ampla]